jgi:hypothetical protein
VDCRVLYVNVRKPCSDVCGLLQTSRRSISVSQHSSCVFGRTKCNEKDFYLTEFNYYFVAGDREWAHWSLTLYMILVIPHLDIVVPVSNSRYLQLSSSPLNMLRSFFNTGKRQAVSPLDDGGEGALTNAYLPEYKTLGCNFPNSRVIST